MNHKTVGGRLEELIPMDGLRQLLTILEECRRRASVKKWIPKEIRITLELDRDTGEVAEAEVPRRYGRNRS